MAPLIGYMANRADRLGAALYQERAVVTPHTNGTPTGWGMGFYQGDEILHKKRPLLEGEALNWETITEGVRSDCAVLHLRQATVGDFRTENTHPFRMRSWTFAHTGTIEAFDVLRESLLARLPDFMRRNVRGGTDSEVLFHVILSFVHDAGALDEADPPGATVTAALRSAVALIDELTDGASAPRSALNLVLTNGRQMYALGRGKPMAYVDRRGLLEVRPDGPLTAEAAGAGLHYVMVVSGDLVDLPAEYVRPPDGTLVCIDRDLGITTQSL